MSQIVARAEMPRLYVTELDLEWYLGCQPRGNIDIRHRRRKVYPLHQRGICLGPEKNSPLILCTCTGRPNNEMVWRAYANEGGVEHEVLSGCSSVWLECSPWK